MAIKLLLTYAVHSCVVAEWNSQSTPVRWSISRGHRYLSPQLECKPYVIPQQQSYASVANANLSCWETKADAIDPKAAIQRSPKSFSSYSASTLDECASQLSSTNFKTFPFITRHTPKASVVSAVFFQHGSKFSSASEHDVITSQEPFYNVALFQQLPEEIPNVLVW